MTCIEKLKIERPDLVGSNHIGGAQQCPNSYAYLPTPDYCPYRNKGVANEKDCSRCWNREIPDAIDDIEDGVTEAMKQQILEESKPHILDSGTRREFETGAVRDIQEGKGRCDLLPLDIVAKYLDDIILDSISCFQRTCDVDFLYNVLWHFAPHWGSKENLGSANSTMLLEVSKHYEGGCAKYGERNWEKGIPVRCYIDSAIRHYLKFLRGDTDEPHDRAFCWNILGAIWTCIHMPELCEYPIKLEVAE